MSWAFEDRFTNLQLRVMSAVVMVPAALLLTWLGGWPFRAFAALLGFGVYLEWLKINSARTGARLSRLLAFAQAALMAVLALGLPFPVLLPAFAAAAVLAGIAEYVLRRSVWGALGLAYCAGSALALSALRGADHVGLMAIALLFAIVWSTDIFAYFGGRSLGGPKLAPAISPGKTVSGAVSGIAAAVAGAIAVAAFVAVPGDWRIPLVAIVLSIVSQAGDLFESWMKRRAGVKDSSTIIPGHGGIFDRVDGLLPAAMAMYAAGAAVSGLANPASGVFFSGAAF